MRDECKTINTTLTNNKLKIPESLKVTYQNTLYLLKLNDELRLYNEEEYDNLKKFIINYLKEKYDLVSYKKLERYFFSKISSFENVTSKSTIHISRELQDYYNLKKITELLIYRNHIKILKKEN